MARSRTVVAGIAWFRADQWQLLRSLASDADTLEQTHAEWESLAEKTIKDLAREGLLARKVDVDVNDLRVWCVGETAAPGRGRQGSVRGGAPSR